MNYNQGSKNSWKTQEMYYQDSPGAFNSVKKTDLPYNEGFALRKNITNKDESFDILFKPHLELFNQDRVLLPSDIRLKLTRNSPRFFIMNKDPQKRFKLMILDATLYIRQLRMSKEWEDKLKNDLTKRGKAIYPMLRANVSNFNIENGTQSYTLPIAKLGKQPIRIYLAFISNIALNGSYELNPFNFLPQNLSEISFILNGKSFPTTALKMHWSSDHSGLYLRAYNELQRTTGVLDLNDGWGVERAAYPKGFFIIGQKLTESFTDESFALEQQGTLSIKFTFEKPTSELISCIIFAEYQTNLDLTPSGAVSLDYTV